MEFEPQIKNNYELWNAISDETIKEWISPKNLEIRKVIKAEGFEIIESIDGKPDKNVEVSLVKIDGQGKYPQHIHKNSDAFFVITSGEAVLLSGKTKRLISPGEKIQVPRGTPHGFEFPEGGSLQFISFQSPPIIDENTGDQDFHLFDRI